MNYVHSSLFYLRIPGGGNRCLWVFWIYGLGVCMVCVHVQCHPPTSSHLHALDSSVTLIDCSSDSCTLTQSKTAGPKIYLETNIMARSDNLPGSGQPYLSNHLTPKAKIRFILQHRICHTYLTLGHDKHRLYCETTSDHHFKVGLQRYRPDSKPCLLLIENGLMCTRYIRFIRFP